MIIMPFDPKSFCRFADQLLDNTTMCSGEEEKVKYGTVVNRSYYAVFLRIRDILDKRYNDPPKKRGEHKRVFDGLIYKMKRYDLVQEYKTLKKDRVKVDYYMGNILDKGADLKTLAEDSQFYSEGLLTKLKFYRP